MKTKMMLRGLALLLSVCMLAATTTACKNGKGNSSESGGTNAYSSKVDNEGLTSDRDVDVEGNTGINDNTIKDNVDESAAGGSIVDRSQVEGVDGSFSNVNLKESVRNLKGKKIVFGTHFPENYSETGSSDAQRCFKALKSIEKDYNCKIEVVQLDATAKGAKDILTAKASGKVLYNVMEMLANSSNQSFKESGISADLTKVSTVGVKTNPWNPAITLLSSYKSKVVGVGVRYDRLEQNIIFFNKNLASKYGLGDFYSLVTSNQWTTEKFMSICEQFYKKTSGKMYAVEAMYPQALLLFMYSNWTSPMTLSKSNGTNKYVFNGTSSAVLDMLTYVQEGVKKGYFNGSYSSNTISNGVYAQSYSDFLNAYNKFADGKALFFIGSNGDSVLPKMYKDSIDDYGILPLPMGPSAKNYSTVITNGLFYSLIDGNPDIENDGAILTAIANRTNVKVADIESRNKTLVRDSKSIEMLTKNYLNKQILNVEMTVGNINGIFYGAAVPAVLGQEKSPKQAMESINKRITTEINEVYKQ